MSAFPPLPPLEWAVCDRCGARAIERGNGLANRCEPCRERLEDFAGRVLEILEPYGPDELDLRESDQIAIGVRRAAYSLGLLGGDVQPCAPCAAHYGDDGRCDEGKPVASPHRAPRVSARPTVGAAYWLRFGSVGWRPVVAVHVTETRVRFEFTTANTSGSPSGCWRFLSDAQRDTRPRDTAKRGKDKPSPSAARPAQSRHDQDGTHEA